MKTRSPVLGYNHNIRYAGRLWHVQTEDSGVQNPHLFTHLFHDGTILATKRLDYDPSSDAGVVQKLMQAQHKAMLRELKQGAFDDKITRFFGTPVVREPVEAASDFAETPKTDPGLPPVVSSAPPPEPMPRPNLTPSRPTAPVSAARSVPRPAVAGVGGRRTGTAGSHPYIAPTNDGVVVTRPAVIVGQPEPRGGTEPQIAPPVASDSIFGDRVSEKSLDEVILAYLSEDLNEK